MHACLEPYMHFEPNIKLTFGPVVAGLGSDGPCGILIDIVYGNLGILSIVYGNLGILSIVYGNLGILSIVYGNLGILSIVYGNVMGEAYSYSFAYFLRLLLLLLPLLLILLRLPFLFFVCLFFSSSAFPFLRLPFLFFVFPFFASFSFVCISFSSSAFMFDVYSHLLTKAHVPFPRNGGIDTSGVCLVAATPCRGAQ
jgi:hypothetical protein